MAVTSLAVLARKHPSHKIEIKNYILKSLRMLRQPVYWVFAEISEAEDKCQRTLLS